MKNHEVKVYEVSTADEFLKKGEKFLLENESLNNTLLGLADSISHKDRLLRKSDISRGNFKASL